MPAASRSRSTRASAERRAFGADRDSSISEDLLGSGRDSVLVEVSCDGGSKRTLLAEIADRPGVSSERSRRIAGFVEGSDACRVRFVARDLGGGSIVEAGVDDFAVSARGCADRGPLGDLDGDRVVGGADLVVLLGAWGG
jgi:hypothetical protein